MRTFVLHTEQYIGGGYQEYLLQEGMYMDGLI